MFLEYSLALYLIALVLARREYKRVIRCSRYYANQPSYHQFLSTLWEQNPKHTITHPNIQLQSTLLWRMKSTYLSLAFLFLLTGSHAAPLQEVSSHASRLPIFTMLTNDHRLTSKNENLSHQFGVSGKRMKTEREDI